MSEERVAKLLVGRTVEISVGSPWDFSSQDGENALRGRIVAVRIVDGTDTRCSSAKQSIELSVTPFRTPTGLEATSLVARSRYVDDKSIVERLAAGEDAEVNLYYSHQAPKDRMPDEAEPFLIGGVRLAD